MMWMYQKLIVPKYAGVFIEMLQSWQMILPPCDLNKSFHLCLLGESSVLKISFEQRVLDSTATDFLPFFGTDIGFCRLEDNPKPQPRTIHPSFFQPRSGIKIEKLSTWLFFSLIILRRPQKFEKICQLFRHN